MSAACCQAVMPSPLLLLGFVRKLLALDQTALKISSKYSFTHVNSVFSLIFALSGLRSATFRTKPSSDTFEFNQRPENSALSPAQRSRLPARYPRCGL